MKARIVFPQLLLTALLLSAPLAVPALADTIDAPPSQKGHRPGPTPEFFTACADKTQGDTVLIENPRGDQIEAVCEQKNGRLVARPLNPSPPPPADDRQQPPEKE